MFFFPVKLEDKCAPTFSNSLQGATALEGDEPLGSEQGLILPYRRICCQGQTQEASMVFILPTRKALSHSNTTSDLFCCKQLSCQ